MHIAVTGASGLVGSTLLPLLTASGHRVTRVVRGESDVDAVGWDPTAASWDAAPVAGIDGLVHLAGENIAATRWNKAVKGRIRASRVHGTRILCEAVARLPSPPRVLVSASAIGVYGHRGDALLDETSAAGQGFLAEVVQQWEAATQPAVDAGIRVVQLRFGVILSPRGGALAKMLLPFKMGVGGRVGGGRQWWSWISAEDAAGAIEHALRSSMLRGTVNAVAPNPVTNAEFTKTLGRLLHRPTFLPMPALAARLALGEMADELLLASTRVAAKKLIESGFTFRHPTLDEALRHLLGASV